MKSKLESLLRAGCLLAILLGVLPSCTMTPLFFGGLELKDTSGQAINGSYAIMGDAHIMGEKRLLIRFFDNKATKLTEVFQERHILMADSMDVTCNRMGGKRMDVSLKNKDGSMVFNRSYRLVNDLPITIVGSAIESQRPAGAPPQKKR